MREISLFKKRILQFSDKLGITKYEIYQNTGISNGVFSQKGGLSEDNLLKFLSYYKEISYDWLITGEGDMLRSSEPISVQPSSVQNVDIDRVIELSSQLGEQTNENKHLHRANMELSAKIEALKKEIEELKSRAADFEEQIQGLKKQIHAYRTTAEPIPLVAEPEPAPLIKKSGKKPPNYPKNPGGEHYF